MSATTFSELEKKYDSFYAPTFEIYIEGKRMFSTAEGRASSVRVDTGIDLINRISFSVGGVYDQINSTFTGLETAGLSVGNSIMVKLGYGSTTEPIMAGAITDVKPNFPDGGAPTVDVVGHDYRYAMSQPSDDTSWENSTVTEAAETIAKEYGFEAVKIGTDGLSEDTETELRLKQLVQDAQSPLEFLKKLLKFDYEMFSRAGTLVFRRPQTDGPPTVSLTYGQGLRTYQRSSSATRSEAKSVEYRGINHYTGEPVSATTERSQGADERRLLKAAMESDQEASQRSKAKQTEIDRSSTSSVTTLGLPDLQIGDWMSLDGLGSVHEQTYDGTYYLQSVNHTIDGSGYTTQATISGPTQQNQ